MIRKGKAASRAELPGDFGPFRIDAIPAPHGPRIVPAIYSVVF
jgi:hypothetical protein